MLQGAHFSTEALELPSLPILIIHLVWWKFLSLG